MKVQGGGENYVHGGISLQELVVPVIVFKNLRTTNKNYVEVKNAELKLLSESRKISNLIFSLEFHQRQPVGDKIQPCTYSLYMTDDEGAVISDRQTVIADKTSDNAAARVFRVRFNLKAGTYDKKKVYRLVIANDIDIERKSSFISTLRLQTILALICEAARKRDEQRESSASWRSGSVRAEPLRA